jgi:hypothetical protein
MSESSCNVNRRGSRRRRVALQIGIVSLVAPLLACGLPALVQETVAPELPAIEEQAVTAIATLPVQGPSLVETASPTSTATPTSAAARFTTNVDANCRGGPGTMYEIVSWLPTGTTVEIIGKDSTGTWWYVDHVPPCWLSSVTGRAEGDLSGVPVLPTPPTPTPVPTATWTPSPTLGVVFRPPVVTRITLPPLVSAANVSVDRTTCVPCPCRATWRGTITATGPLTASYVWETSLGAGVWVETSMRADISFSGAGTLSTYDYWQQSPAADGHTVIARLHVTAPNSIYSNEVAVRYCAP